MAAELGSDIPFCLDGGTQFCFGRGEVLEPVNTCNDELALILVKDPTVAVSTPWAYGMSKEIKGNRYLKSESEFEQRRQQLREQSWLCSSRDSDIPPLKNDLQLVVAPEIPAVQNALKILSDLPGSIGVAMSGSGPSCFALYSTYAEAKTNFEHNRMRLKASGLDSWCCSFQIDGVNFES